MVDRGPWGSSIHLQNKLKLGLTKAMKILERKKKKERRFVLCQFGQSSTDASIDSLDSRPCWWTTRHGVLKDYIWTLNLYLYVSQNCLFYFFNQHLGCFRQTLKMLCWLFSGGGGGPEEDGPIINTRSLIKPQSRVLPHCLQTTLTISVDLFLYVVFELFGRTNSTGSFRREWRYFPYSVFWGEAGCLSVRYRRQSVYKP